MKREPASQSPDHPNIQTRPDHDARPETVINNPFSRSAERVLGEVGSDPTQGLSDNEVMLRRRRFGKNLLRQKKARGWFGMLLEQFRGIIVWLLAAAAALAFYLGDLHGGIAISVVLVINAAIGFVTEFKAIRSMEALRRLAQVQTRVRRAGQTKVVNAREIVPGDIVIVEAGDIVTADMRLLEAASLQCDESALTGESTPVDKQVESLDADTSVADRSNMAFKGTAVARGNGEGVVVATGMATELGRISRLAEAAEPEVSPLEKRLDRLGQRLVWLTLLLAGGTVAAGVLRGREFFGMLETGIALAVAAVPEGLPIVATLCLARGVWRMAARNALIARLSAVETLGATTVILTDKTGTLTENRMAVAHYLLAGTTVDVDGSSGAQAFTRDEEAIEAAENEPLSMALRIGALCNNAELPPVRESHAGKAGSGDPMELALLTAARLAGFELSDLHQQYRELEEYAFDPDLKMMATVHRKDDTCFFAIKGAPEQVIERCRSVRTADGERPLDAHGRADWTERGRKAARSGYRMLALAYKTDGDASAPPYEDLVLVSLVSLVDPLRSDIRDAVDACKRAGVRVIMLTGDHAETAAEIARQAGLGNGELHVIEGSELARLDSGALDETTRSRILGADVFARVSPETKLQLVSLFQSTGEIVAMTGDGVNDAPALKKADIGIAMGQRGTEVAREAAHVVLQDDAFSTIVVAMREGRIIFGNIRKFVIYLLSCNVSEILVVGLAVTAGLPTPLLPLQILYLNLVTDVFPAFALGLGEGDDQAMARPPRDPKEPIIDNARWLLIGVLGGLITAATLGAFAIAHYWLSLSPDQAVTVAFLTLATAQLWNVFNMRAAGSDWLHNEVVLNRYVWSALLLCIGLIAFAIWLPGLSSVMRLVDPGASGVALALTMSVLPLLAGQVFLSSVARRLPSLDRT